MRSHRRSTRRSVLVGLVGLSVAMGSMAPGPAGATPPDGEVVSGVPARAGELPFVVGILNANIGENRNALVCGGTLIAPRRVLTAAHCVDGGLAAANFEVLVNTTSLDGSGQRVALAPGGLHIHPRWSPGSGRNDVAALDLAVTTGPVVTIPRPAQAFAPPGTRVTVAGWGWTIPSGATSYDLRKASFPVVSNADCRSAYGDDGNGLTFDPTTMLCAGEQAGGGAACFGDSGGPLVVRRGGTAYQVGIVSWSRGCGLPGFPGVYARVSHYASGNDYFADATRLPAQGGTARSRTYLSGKEPGEPNHARNRGGASSWFAWTAPVTRPVTIDTIGSNFDTVLAVYRGVTVGALSAVAVNDDAGGLQSRVQFTARRGVTYRIAVDGFNGRFGDVVVRVR